MFRSVLFAMAIFAGIAGAALVPARLAAASGTAPAASTIPLTPGPAEAGADPAADGTLSRAATIREQRAAAAAAAAARPPSVQDLIRSAFQPLGEGAVQWALKIAWCESKYDPNAVNGASDAQGLFQFLPSTWRGTPFAGASPFDPAANAQAAAWLLQTYGAGQWECVA